MESKTPPVPWNPIPKAVHITVERPTNTSEEEFILIAELRCGTHTISDDKGYSYEFGFNKLFVEIQPENCRLKTGRRIGDVDKSYVVKKKQRTTTTRSQIRKLQAGLKAGVSLKLSDNPTSAITPTGNLTASGEMQKNNNNQGVQETEEIIETIFHPVITNGQNELIVQAPSNQVLRGAYLSQEDLCTIVPDRDRRFSINVSVYFQPLSLEITACASETRTWFSSDLSKNKLAFAKLLVAKYLSETNQADVTNALGRALTAADVYVGGAEVLKDEP
jgi:hypothetical protein